MPSRTHCAICRRPCVPLADYYLPTCISCDEAMQAVLDRGSLTPEPRTLAPHGTHAAFNRHRGRGEEPCRECWVGEREFQRLRARETRRRKRVA